MSNRSKKPRRDKKRPQRAAGPTPGRPDEVEVALKASYDLLQRGQFEKAEQVLRKALGRHPGDHRLLSNLVAALENQSRSNDAQRAAEAAVAAHPDEPQARNNLGAILKFQGRLDDARAEFRRAVELAPRYAAAWRNLASVKTFRDPDDADLAAMRALLPKVARGDEGRTSLYFAIAKAYDEIGDVDEAFAHFERGNRHHRGQVRYSLEDTARLVDETTEFHGADFVGRGPAEGAADDAPILVVGMPRCGSTLVEQILASHPDAEGVGEVPDLPRAIQPHVTDIARRVRTVSLLPDDELAAIGRSYARSLAHRAPGAKRVVDKYLTNFVHVGTLRRALPNARVVHVRRDPMDNGFGCFRTHFTSSVPYVYDFDGIAGTYALTERLMAHWREVCPEAVLEVEYEALVADLEGQTRRMLDFVGLGWDDACLKFHETRRRVNSASSTQVRRPLYDSSIGRWRPYAAHLRPLAAAFEAHGIDPRFEEGAAD